MVKILIGYDNMGSHAVETHDKIEGSVNALKDNMARFEKYKETTEDFDS